MAQPDAPPVVLVDPLAPSDIRPLPLPPVVRPHLDCNIEDNFYSDGAAFMLTVFQHLVVSLGQPVLIANLLVPLMGGGDDEIAEIILVSMFVSGFVTLIHSFLGTLQPSSMTFSSYAYIIPTMAIAQRLADSDPLLRFGHTMRHVQGALMVASIFQLAIASLGVAHFGRWLSPLYAAPLVILSGLGFLSAGFPQILLCSEVVSAALAIVAFLSIILPQVYFQRVRESYIWSPETITMLERLRVALRRFGILVSLGLCWLLAYILSVTHAYRHRASQAHIACRTERYGLLRSAPGIWFPLPLQWGTPLILYTDVFPMIAASIVSTIECSGGFIASTRLSGATPIPPFVLRRGAIIQAVGSFFGSMFGTVTGITVSIESVGLVGLTHVAVRDVTPVIALLMIFSSMIGKIGIFLAAIPFPIVAAWYCIFCSTIVSSGFSLLQYCRLSNRRNIMILGCSIVMGLVVPLYCRMLPPSSTVSDIVLAISTSAAGVGILTALLLDLLMPMDDVDRADSGIAWFTHSWVILPHTRTFAEIYYSIPLHLSSLLERVYLCLRGASDRVHAYLRG